MKSDVKHVCSVAFGLVVLAMSTSFAQVAPPPEVKTGDRLTYSYVGFQLGIKNIVELPAVQEVASLAIEPATEDRTYSSANDSNVLRTNKQFGPLLFRSTSVVLKNRPANVLRGKPVVGQAWEYEASYSRANEVRDNCKVIDSKSKAAVSEGSDMTVQVKGIPTTLKTLLITHDSIWYNGACGNGTAKTRFLYSPALNEFVSRESINYYLDRVNSGSSRTVLLSVD